MNVSNNWVLRSLSTLASGFALSCAFDLPPEDGRSGESSREVAFEQVAGSVHDFDTLAPFGDPAVSSCTAATLSTLNYPATKQIQEPDTSELSISFWFFAHNYDHQVHSLVSKGNAVSTHSGWRFYVEDGSLVFRVGARNPATGARYSAATSKAVSPGRWYHVVGVIDRQLAGEEDDREQVRLYLDDEFEPQPSGGGGASSRFLEMPAAAEINSPQPLRIGWTRNPDNEQHMCSNGIVRHLFIYPRALSRSDITELYNQHPTRHKERSNDTSPTDSYFSKSSEREFGSPGLASCSAGTVGSLGYPASAEIADPMIGETSIAFWFYARDFSHSVHSLLAKGNAVSSHAGWRFFVQNNNLIFRVGLQDPGTGQRYSAGTSKTVVAGRWYHVVGVIDRQMPGETDDREQVRLYLDDAFDPQPSGGGGASSRFLVVPSTAKVDSPQPLRIGWTRNPDNEHHMCSNGKVTGIRIYRRALARSEISELARSEPSMKSERLLFDPAQDSFNISYHSFRIPSLVRTPSGSLLAFAEGRDCSHTDYGNINLVYKRSTDEGVTWSSLREVVGSGAGTWGNPTAVSDRETGRVWLFLNWNDANVSQYGDPNPCTGEPTSVVATGDRPVYVTWSDDDGLTWATPLKQNTSTRHFQPSNAAWDAVGPGVGIQVEQGPHAGRLIVPASKRNIYSDDNGATWKHQGFSSATSEGTIVELSDGGLLRNDRASGSAWDASKRRLVSKGGIETGFAAFAAHPYLLDPRVEGSSLLYSTSPHRILFLNPSHTGERCNMRLRMSYDDGSNWPLSRAVHDQLTPGQTCSQELGGYSSLATTESGAIGALVERGFGSHPRAIEFHLFNLSWLVGEPN